MLVLSKGVTLGSVIWANRKIYYDRPELLTPNKKSMYLITMVNDDYFYGCPLTSNPSKRNHAILLKRSYPIREDSRISECLYKLTEDDIVSNKGFMIEDGIFKFFQRNLYQRIVVNEMDSPKRYNDEFANYYLETHKPNIDNVVLYPSNERVFKFYYVYDEDEENYYGVKLNRCAFDTYEIIDDNLTSIPKNIRFYDYYLNHNLKRNYIDDILESNNRKLIKKFNVN